jgi:serine/threonine-protein kinase
METETNTPAGVPREVVAGQVVGGKWRIIRPIGRGGMGAVFEGQNISIGKKVALKFIDAEFATHPDIASRFQREAEAASLVDSAHIVQVFDSGTSDQGIPYIVMELLSGEDLRSRIRRLGKLTPAEAVHIVAQTLRGLHRAHQAGIVHRDLKPDNVFLVDREGEPLFAKIVDFGISKIMHQRADGVGTLTRQGVVLGTPFYMSPEQAQASPDLDLRTDVWSVGAILYECLAGQPPYQGDAYEAIIVAICTADARDIRSIEPTVPAPLAAVVHRALSRDRSRRFQSAKEMLDALAALGFDGAAAYGATPRPLSRAAESTASIDGGLVGEGLRAASAGTRVSWAKPPNGGSAFSATLVDPNTGATRRSGYTRPRALVALGIGLMMVTFLLTFAVLRLRRATPQRAAATSPERQTAVGPPVANRQPIGDPIVLPAQPSAAPAQATEMPRTDTRASERPAPSAAAPAAGRATAMPVRPRKGAATSNAEGPPASSPVAPTSSTMPAGKTGVAGGLQIKTTYP